MIERLEDEYYDVFAADEACERVDDVLGFARRMELITLTVHIEGGNCRHGRLSNSDVEEYLIKSALSSILLVPLRLQSANPIPLTDISIMLDSGNP